MDSKINTMSIASICEGCLSVDRKLTPIYGGDCEFDFILDSLDHISHSLLLCWECMALLRRAMRFRDQVKVARDRLVRHMLHKSTLPSLSQLTITNNETLQIIADDNTKIEHQDLSNCTHEKEAVRRQITKRSSEKNEEDNPSQNNTVPLAFIKVEERDDYDDVDEPFIDESRGDEQQTDDKDHKEALNSNAFQYEVPVIKKKIKSKRKKEDDDFNESDDEPLKKKTEGKEKKPRGRRKKKGAEEKDKAKTEGGKHRNSKRERPAGVVDNQRVRSKLEKLNVPLGQLERVLLSWQEVEAERAKALTHENFTRHDYRCYDCVLGFNHRVKLDNHMVKHDPSSGALACGVCGVRCRDEHALAAHRRRHRLRWRCAVCGCTWSTAGGAADHLARAHGAPQATHRCRVCGEMHRTLGKLRNHLKNHAERQKCELCGKTFRDRTSLRTHLFIHKGEKEYSCPHCDKKFLFKKAMEVHLVTHDASAQLYCYECNVNFKNRNSFYQHMKYNLKHIDPEKLKYACGLCDKRFAKASRLREHHTAVHLKATPVRCALPGCTFACSSRPVLRTHVRMIHRNQRAVRNHVCDTCGKAYTAKKILEGHLRSHTGERPFRCALCPAAFGYHAALYNHNKLVHLKKGKTITRTEPDLLI